MPRTVDDQVEGTAAHSFLLGFVEPSCSSATAAQRSTAGLDGGCAASPPLLAHKLYTFSDTSHEPPRAGSKRCKDVSPPMLAVTANEN